MSPHLAPVLLLTALCAGADDPPRGYSIPLLDLSADASRQVVVDREPGQYLGHPTTALLADGHTLLAVYPQGHGRGAIVMKRSADGGRTWSERLPVPASWASSKETPTLHRIVDADGGERLLLFSGLYPIRLSTSADEGQTWSELAPIGGAEPFGGIVTMSDLLRARDGRLLAFFHDDQRFLRGGGERGIFDVFQTESTDGGRTWGAPRSIARRADVDLCEPGAVRSPDGVELTLLLRENRRAKNSFRISSRDEGRTWSAPTELPGALTGDRHVARYSPDGRLVVCFRDTTLESPTRGDFVAWVGTYADVMSGREGRYRVRLLDNQNAWDCGYSGVEVLGDGTFVATTYGHWDEGQPAYVVSVRFTLAELDELAAREAAQVEDASGANAR